ncbi:MAG: hypothetical protein Q9227_004574 [Pyrenula ochraceoflavens]
MTVPTIDFIATMMSEIQIQTATLDGDCAWTLPSGFLAGNSGCATSPTTAAAVYRQTMDGLRRTQNPDRATITVYMSTPLILGEHID